MREGSAAQTEFFSREYSGMSVGYGEALRLRSRSILDRHGRVFHQLDEGRLVADLLKVRVFFDPLVVHQPILERPAQVAYGFLHAAHRGEHFGHVEVELDVEARRLNDRAGQRVPSQAIRVEFERAPVLVEGLRDLLEVIKRSPEVQVVRRRGRVHLNRLLVALHRFPVLFIEKIDRPEVIPGLREILAVADGLIVRLAGAAEVRELLVGDAEFVPHLRVGSAALAKSARVILDGVGVGFARHEDVRPLFSRESCWLGRGSLAGRRKLALDRLCGSGGCLATRLRLGRGGGPSRSPGQLNSRLGKNHSEAQEGGCSGGQAWGDVGWSHGPTSAGGVPSRAGARRCSTGSVSAAAEAAEAAEAEGESAASTLRP